MEKEPANFKKAVAVFVKGIGDHPYGTWAAAAAEDFRRNLDSPPHLMPFPKNVQVTFPRKMLLDIFIYTRFAHQPNFDQPPEKAFPPDREQQFRECLDQVKGNRAVLTWLFLIELRMCCGEMISVGRLIAGWFDHHCRHHNISVELPSSLRDDHPGIGALEKEENRTARLFDEKTEQLAKELWQQAREPSGGYVAFLEIARPALRKATD